MADGSQAQTATIEQRQRDILTFAAPHRREIFAGGASFGASGTYERIEGVVSGALDPAHPANRGIALLDQAPRDAEGLVRYQSAYVLLRPARPRSGQRPAAV